MRSRLLTSVTMLAVLASAPGPLPFAAAQAGARTDQGFCRNAGPLPRLGAETPWQAQQTSDGAKTKDSKRDRRTPAEAMPPPPPPPPPSPVMAPPPVAMDSSGAAEVIATGSRVGGESASSARGGAGIAAVAPAPGSFDTARILPPRPYPRPQPRSGILTAGEHDDLLNPELYAAYVNRNANLGQQIRDLPRVDATRVLTVQVRDRAGRAVPFADVVVTCSDGNSITMATQADGSAVFFPGLDRLSERVTVAAHKGSRTIADARPLIISNAPGGQYVGLSAAEAATRVTKLDLMLVIDTTGSMGDEIAYLQSELRSIIGAISTKHRDLDIRVGFVFYRDIGDEYVTRTVAFDRDIGRVQGVLARQNANGGGDYPEAMDQAMIRAVGQDWRPDAVKSLLLVADAPPHDDKFGRTWQAAEVARAKRIHITPVAASGVADKAEYAMRAMAAATQSRYLFLTDDSGVGNPHAPPAVDCYLVTRLDALVRRVIDSQISGRRIEPDKQEIIRSVGNYDAGKCILPADFKWQNG